MNTVGANILLSAEGNIKNTGSILCYFCNSENAEGSWFCSNCGKIITELDFLRKMQRKIKYEQTKIRKNISKKLSVRFKIDENEFIHYAHDAGNETEAYIVTEKRFIRFFEKKGFLRKSGKKDTWEFNWSDIANVSEPTPIFIGGVKICFTTFNDQEKIIWTLPDVGEAIFKESMVAINNYLHGKRDSRAKLYYSDKV